MEQYTKWKAKGQGQNLEELHTPEAWTPRQSLEPLQIEHDQTGKSQTILGQNQKNQTEKITDFSTADDQ